LFGLWAVVSGAMRIFINNVDGFLAGAICADLYKLSHHIVGTRKGRQDDLVPPMVKRIVPRVEVRRLLKAVAACDIVVYDLHDADLEEMELVLRALQVSELHHRMTFILISSVGVWARTAKAYEEIPVETDGTAGNEEGEVAGEAEGVEAPDAGAAEADAAEDGDGAGYPAGDAAVPAAPAQPQLRPVALKSEDYTRRVPAPKFQEWKAVETQVLSLKEKGLIRPYIVCSGIPYGNGEDAFLGLFKAAWQTRSSLRVIGDGGNYIPLVHARDVARLTRHVIEVGPVMDYHVAVDRGDMTQRALVQTCAKQFGLPAEPKSVTVAEALLAELADILTMDLRLEPCELMNAVAPPEPEINVGEGEEQGEAADVDVSATASNADGSATDEAKVEETEDPGNINILPAFRWWCEKGLGANIDQVAKEFSRWRRLSPVRLCVAGPPGSGASKLGQRLAELYNVPSMTLDEIVEEQRNLETPIGQQVREQLEVIEANKANPKSQGPFILPASLSVQLVEDALKTRPGTHRGFVLAGFPQTMEEANALFFEEPAGGDAAPAGKKDPKAKEAEPETEAVPKASFLLDTSVFVTSSDEVCLQRAQSSEEKPYVEKDFQVAMANWKQVAEALPEFFTTKLNVTTVTVNADLAIEEETAKHEAAVKEAEAAEAEAPVAPDPADLVALAAGSWAWLDTASQTATQSLESQRSVFNFMPPTSASVSVTEQAAEKELERQKQVALEEAAAAEAAAAAAAAAEAAKRAEKSKAEMQRVEHVKKEELARLEKHSEPLRLYLMKFVVPALTGALVDVCREQPEDAVGYLAEYLKIYSEVFKERAAEREAAAAAAAAEPKPA